MRAAPRRIRAEGCSDHATIQLGRASHVRRVAVAPSTSPHRNSTANWLTSASRTACCSALSEGMLRAIVQSLLQPSEPHAHHKQQSAPFLTDGTAMGRWEDRGKLNALPRPLIRQGLCACAVADANAQRHAPSRPDPPRSRVALPSRPSQPPHAGPGPPSRLRLSRESQTTAHWSGGRVEAHVRA